MVRFVIYKNSILATICSMFGAVCIVMAVGGLFGREIGILPGIAMIAVGLGLMFLAGLISEHKEKKKQAKAAAKRGQASAAQTSRSASYAPRQTVQTASAPAANGKPVNKSAVFAGILFLLVGALGIWACQSPKIIVPTWDDMLNSEQVMLIPAGILMAIGAFRTKKLQKVSVLFLLGFACLTFGSGEVALNTYNTYGSGSYSTSSAIHYAMYFAPILCAAAYLLMILFTLFSMERIKGSMGGIVRALWWLPVIVLAAGFVKWFDDNYVANAFTKVFYPGFIGLKYLPREFLEAIARVFLILAIFFTGICFRRLSKKPAEAYVRPEPQPEPQYAAPQYTAPRPEPQPEPRYTAPEPPRPDNQQIEKQLQAYKDLLDCGILSREEYDQKVRELM